MLPFCIPLFHPSLFVSPCPLSPSLIDSSCEINPSKESLFLFMFACVFLQPYGVNQPGPYVSYTTTDSNGNLKNASGNNYLFLFLCILRLFTGHT